MTQLHKEILNKLLSAHRFYITVETKFTIHHIERLMGSIKDRGKWKWIAEMKLDYWEGLRQKENILNYEEAQRSHIDGGDLFPRYMFLDQSLLNELFAWMDARGLEITEIKTPKI